MRVRTVYLGLVRNRIGKTDEQYDMEEGSSLADLLKILARRYGETHHFSFEAKNESHLDPTFITIINGIQKNPQTGSSVLLKDGDVVTLMTVISGG